MNGKMKLSVFLFLMLFSNGFLFSQVEAKKPLFTVHIIVNKSFDSRVRFVEEVIKEISNLNIEFIQHNLIPTEINPIIWNYPFIDFDYIPTYDQGGYDCGVWGTSYYFEMSGFQIFTEGSMSQYNNSDFNVLVDLFENEQNPEQRTNYAHQLQTFLYNDLPEISLYHNQSLLAKRKEVKGLSLNEKHYGYDRAENWENIVENIIRIGVFEERDEFNMFRINPFEWWNDMFGQFRSYLWMQNVYGGLFQHNLSSLNWEPEIARNHSISSDKMSVTVDIDPQAKFSDGSPVLAEDVKYSYQLHMSPEVGSYSYKTLTTYFHNNDSIEVLDSNTIRFNYSYVENFPLTALSLGIIDKSYLEPAISTYGYKIFSDMPLTSDVNDTLVKSCGPFKVDSYEYSPIELVPNPYYKDLTSSGGNNAKLERIEIHYMPEFDNALSEIKSGWIHIIEPTDCAEIISYVESEPLLQVLKINEGVQHGMTVNMLHPIIGTGELTPNGTEEAGLYIRKAISHAIPRQKIIDDLFEGIGNPGITTIPKACGEGFNGDLSPYAYDLELAKDYLRQAGYKIKEVSFNGIIIILILGLLSLSAIPIFNRKRI